MTTKGSLDMPLFQDEKNFWYCRECENEGCSEDCGKEDFSEIADLAYIFGTTTKPANVKYNPSIKKVIVTSDYIELEEDFELTELSDMHFKIVLIKCSKYQKLPIIHLMRND